MGDRAYHDTYAIVINSPVFLLAVGLALCMLILWVPSKGLLARTAGRWRLTLLHTFFIGFILGMFPVVLVTLSDPASFAEDPQLFPWTNRFALIGGALMGLAAIVTLVIFFRQAMRHRRK